jgi:hypothetical protein
MEASRGLAWLFGFVAGTAAAVLLLGLLLAGPAEAAHCDDDAMTLVPACEPGHVTVDNWPSEFPAPSECDGNAGLRSYTLEDGTTTCVVEVQSEPKSFQAAVFGGSAVLVVLTALLFSTAARKG